MCVPLQNLVDINESDEEIIETVPKAAEEVYWIDRSEEDSVFVNTMTSFLRETLRIYHEHLNKLGRTNRQQGFFSNEAVSLVRSMTYSIVSCRTGVRFKRAASTKDKTRRMLVTTQPMEASGIGSGHQLWDTRARGWSSRLSQFHRLHKLSHCRGRHQWLCFCIHLEITWLDTTEIFCQMQSWQLDGVAHNRYRSLVMQWYWGLSKITWKKQWTLKRLRLGLRRRRWKPL